MTMPSRTAALALAVALGAAPACGGDPSTAADASDGLDAIDTSTEDTGGADVGPGDTGGADTAIDDTVDTVDADTIDPDTTGADTTDTAGDTMGAPVELCGNGADDDGDGRADCADADCCADDACVDAEVCTTPPQDPAADPPPLATGESTTMDAIVAFLTAGDDPVQRGVAPGALVPRRVSLLRGRVRDRAGPLAGARVDVLGQRHLGLTVSRADGAWDLVVNADQPVTLRFSLAGYVPVQRTVAPSRRQSRRLPDVVLTAYDAAVTTVSLGAAGAQVARGSAVSDDDGERRATLVVPPGTSAAMTTPDGATTALTEASVRATELTVGADGPLAMPGDLPPSSAYTYAVELSVDEAVSAGATRVDFDPPLALYVEDFIGFPVGSAVPLGAYDREAARWVTADNGRVVEIVGITGGLADLRVADAAGPASAEELAALGVTDAERARLAELYAVGQRLWRSPIPHFTPWDCNWPYAPPDDAAPPPGTPDPDDPDPDEPDPDDDDEDDDNSCRDGSIVDIQAQGLRERIPVAGTPWSLNYSSLRAEGRLTANSVDIPITLAGVPDSVVAVTATVDVAGQHAARTFSSAPNQRWLYLWDGRDGFGRPVHSAVEARITVTYRYPLVFYSVPSEFQGAFNRLLAEDTATTPVVASGGVRDAVDVTREWVVELSRARAQVFSLAGWSLSPHHVYDPEASALHRGDGSRKAASGLGLVVETWAGGAAGTGFDGDGGQARAAQVNSPSGMTVGPDGAFYFADTGNHRVRRVDADGIITTVAGNGVDIFPSDGENGDGGPALDAALPLPSDVAFGPDGSLYISQLVGRVRRVDPDGVIHTVAGGGTAVGGADADGHPATEVVLSAIWNLAVASDGTLFFSETPRQRVRRVGADGVLTTWLGGGTAYPNQVDGERGSAVGLTELGGIGLAPDGTLYAALLNQHLVLRVSPDGRVTRFAGTGFAAHSGDGGRAIDAGLRHPGDVSVGPDGSVWILESGYFRRVTPGGVITTVAGDGNYVQSAEGLPALKASLASPRMIFASPDGAVYFDDGVNGNSERIRRLASVLPRFDGAATLLPSEDGAELYVIDASGRHLETRDGLTGEPRLTFAYDDAGRLASITDGYGATTTIARAADGTPTAIEAPDGRTTLLSVGDDGLLSAVTNPAGDVEQLSYDAGGLLTERVDPRGGTHTYTYDEVGRLLSDTGPGGRSLTLSRDRSGGDAFTVSAETAEGRVERYSVDGAPGGGEDRTTTAASGLAATKTRDPSGGAHVVAVDGTATDLALAPDPRFGMRVPYVAALTVTTPGGLTFQHTATRTATLPGGVDPAVDPFGYDAFTMTETTAGHTATTVYERATRTTTATSPAGRAVRVVQDAGGNVVERQRGDLLVEHYAYDARGRLVAASQGARAIALAWDDDGDLVGVTDSVGRVHAAAHDAAGRTVTETGPGGGVRAFTRDPAGNVTALTTPTSAQHAFTYDADDELASYAAPDVSGGGAAGRTYDHDLDGLPRSWTDTDGAAVTMTYDDAGRPASRHDSSAAGGTVTKVRDAVTGRVTTLNGPDAVTVTRSYDGPLLTGLAWTGDVAGGVTRTYDAGFQVASETVAGSEPVPLGRDEDGLLTSAGPLTITRSEATERVTALSVGALVETFDYDGYGELVGQAVTLGGATLWAATWTRDDAGQLTSRTEAGPDGVTRAFTYAWDAAGRLARVLEDDVEVEAYAYDLNGNRSDLVRPSAEQGTYDARDRLTALGGWSYTHDAAGAVAGRAPEGGGPGWTYAIDRLGTLRGATAPDGRAITYVIDGAGRRVAKRVDDAFAGAWIYRDALTPAAALDEAGAVIQRFVYGRLTHVPDVILEPSATLLIVHDQVGSPRLVLDATTGAVVQELRYTAFGVVTIDSAPGRQPFGFAGGLYDADTELVRMGAREYDPAAGRFLSPDPIGFAGGDTNLYAYAYNDPVDLLDPDGRNPLVLVGVGLVAIYLAYELNEAFERGEDFAESFNFGDYKKTDALQHCYASCSGSLEVGRAITGAAGAAKEIGDSVFGDQDAREMVADLDNNLAGRECAADPYATDDDCKFECLNRLNNGLLNTTDN